MTDMLKGMKYLRKTFIGVTMAKKESLNMGIYFWILCLINYSYCFSQNFLTKCLSHHDNQFSLNCPKNQVISNFDIDIGSSTNSTCSYGNNDCIFQSSYLLKQRNDCYWNRTCGIDVKMKDINGTCNGKRRGYVRIGMAQCVHKKIIYSLCSGGHLHINASDGVIKSHLSYPNHYMGPFTCKKRLWMSKNSTLVLQYQAHDLNPKDKLRLCVLKSGKRIKSYRVRPSRTKYIPVPDGVVDIVWRVKSNESSYRGFVMRFSRLENGDKLKSKPSLQNFDIQHVKVPPTLQWSNKVSATIQECTTWIKKTISLHCPVNSVIYSLEVYASISNGPNTCSVKKKACKGYTPGLLVQVNECYWQPKCDVTLGGLSFIVFSKRMACVGQMANVLSVSGFKCVQQDKVFKVCDKTAISNDYGLIKSHTQYPWHYEAENNKCRRNIKIGKGKQLYFHLLDADIDQTDRFTVHHINRRCKTLVADGQSTNVRALLTGGRLRIVFQTSRDSRRGRGFYFSYMRTKADPEKKDFRNCNRRKSTKRKTNFGKRRKT